MKSIIPSDSDDDYNGNDRDNKDRDNKENILNFNDLEYRKRDLALKERELALREREAKICVMELTNLEKEHELKLIRK